MRENKSAAPPKTSPADGRGRLDSWKAIAAYLKRSVRTATRWEKEEGLPVRRHLHRKLGSVYAYKSEIDAWWNSRKASVESRTRMPHGPTRPAGRRSVAVAVLVAAAILAVATYYGWPLAERPLPNEAPRVMLAVLPFEDLSNDPDQEYFSDGLTEEMITELGRLHAERLGVIARTSVMRYKGTRETARQISGELGVDYLLEGSVRREGGRVRISAQLIRSSDQTHLWARSYEEPADSILEVQAMVARDVANEIRLTLTPQEEARLASSRKVDPRAYEAYLMGRYFLFRFTGESVRKGLEYLNRAVEVDPRYAAAYASISQGNALLNEYGGAPPQETTPLILEAALKAVELDRENSDAHTSLGLYYANYAWNWVEAEKAYRRALDLNPNDATANYLYSTLLAYLGRFDQAVAASRKAKDLDPLSLPINVGVGWVYTLSQHYDEAVLQLNHALEMDPSYPATYLNLGAAYFSQGMYEEAVTVLRQGRDLSKGMPAFTTLLGYTYARQGRTKEALGQLENLREIARESYVSSFDFAVLYMGRGPAAGSRLPRTSIRRACVDDADPERGPGIRAASWSFTLSGVAAPDGFHPITHGGGFQWNSSRSENMLPDQKRLRA